MQKNQIDSDEIEKLFKEFENIRNKIKIDEKIIEGGGRMEMDN